MESQKPARLASPLKCIVIFLFNIRCVTILIAKQKLRFSRKIMLGLCNINLKTILAKAAILQEEINLLEEGAYLSTLERYP